MVVPNVQEHVNSYSYIEPVVNADHTTMASYFPFSGLGSSINSAVTALRPWTKSAKHDLAMSYLGGIPRVDPSQVPSGQPATCDGKVLQDVAAVLHKEQDEVAHLYILNGRPATDKWTELVLDRNTTQVSRKTQDGVTIVSSRAFDPDAGTGGCVVEFTPSQAELGKDVSWKLLGHIPEWSRAAKSRDRAKIHNSCLGGKASVYDTGVGGELGYFRA